MLIPILLLVASASRGLQEPREEPTEPRPSVVLGGAAWLESASGWLFITRGSEPGSATRARQGHEVKLDEEWLALGEASVDLTGPHGLGVRFIPISQSGVTETPDDFIFHGTTFPAGREVRTDFNLFRTDVDYQVALQPLVGLDVTLHFGAEIWDFSARLRTTDALPPLDEKRAFSSGFWLSGVEGTWGLGGIFSLRAGLLGGVEGADKYFFELEGSVLAKLRSHVAAAAGYRFDDLRFRQGTNRGDFSFRGPFVGVELSF